MQKVVITFLSVLFSVSSFAKQWEYKFFDLNHETISTILADEGKKGWELVTCPTTGAVSYTTSAGKLERYGTSVYCVLKREVTEPKK